LDDLAEESLADGDLDGSAPFLPEAAARLAGAAS